MNLNRNVSFAFLLFLALSLFVGSATAACCEDGETEPDNDDCTKYYVCCSGEFVHKQCDSGDWWNLSNKKCEYNDGNNNCPCTKCIERETEEDVNDCTKYKLCLNGNYQTVTCGSGLYWDANAKKCEKDEGQCIPTPTPTPTQTPPKPTPPKPTPTPTPPKPTPPKPTPKPTPTPPKPTPAPPSCEDGQIKVNPVDCSGFLQCVNNAYVERNCPKSNYFNMDLLECVEDKTNVCIPKYCDDECCDHPYNWLGPVDKNCSAFIQCHFGIKTELNCPNNLQFNNATKTCDFPENVGCEDGSAPPSGPSAGPSGTYCESHGECVGKRDGTTVSNAQKVCSESYAVCQCECEVAMNCPDGLVYNTVLGACDWPKNVGC